MEGEEFWVAVAPTLNKILVTVIPSITVETMAAKTFHFDTCIDRQWWCFFPPRGQAVDFATVTENQVNIIF